MIHRLVLASHNAGKLRELQSLFDAWGGRRLELLSPQGLGLSEPNEPYNTFIENALHKARQASAATGLPALADDSGLAVLALGGAPGVHSSTYAGVLTAQLGEPREGLRQRQDAANISRLLQELAVLGPSGTAGVSGADRAEASAASRSARFVCTLIALRSAQDPEPLVAQGRWDGEILPAPRGQGGFGYDPVMWIREAQATVAELGHDAKNSVSHRARAAAQMREQMQQVWGWWTE
jgi:XTP/dITP diphosphohydrolase